MYVGPTLAAVTTGARPVVPGPADLGLTDALAQLTFAVADLLGRIAQAHDVSIVQVRLFGILRDRRPTITELATFLQLDKSSVTGLVDRAEDRGLVERIASPVDRRSVQVALTPTGREVFERARASFEAELEDLVAELSPARRQQLSEAASAVALTAARRRGIVEPAADRPPPGGGG